MVGIRGHSGANSRMKESDYRTVRHCRICGGRDLLRVLDLGETPLANAFVDPAHQDGPEPYFPLQVLRCAGCGLVQLSIVVRPEVLFSHYLYATSASAPMADHFALLAEELVRRHASAGSLVIEIGSNDGVLLRSLRDRGANVLGIEPARNLADAASAEGLETWAEFFNASLAARIVAERGRARVVVANNVLAHIDDLEDAVAALDLLLEKDGVFVAEVPYLGALLDQVEYDTIYHEHLSYFALRPLEMLFARAGLELFDVRRLSLHGGSIRIHVGRAGAHAPTADLAAARASERAAGLTEATTYARFAQRVAASRDALRVLLNDLRRDGRSIAALGATAKSCTLLNYCGLGTETIDFVADSTPVKQGRLTPGTHIPLRPEGALLAARSDYAVLLAWNYADAVLRRHADYVARGGRFIHPIPLARVMEG